MKLPFFEKTDIQISTDTEYQALSCTTQHNMLSMLSLTAPQVDEQNIRPSIDLVAVVDKSGSMCGNNMKLVKNTLKFIIKQLTKKDKLAVVSYSDYAQVEFGLTPMDDNGKRLAIEKVDQIRTDGWTNLSGGLEAAVNMMKQRLVKNEVSSILLFTDGLANRGETNM
jgi:Mg-chelatase subunit ChlD